MTIDTGDCVEQALQFACGDTTLIGIVARPAGPRRAIGVVIVVGGPQYRAGSHRQFVLLARRLAGAGHATLRFDLSGMGDSGGAARGFEASDADIDRAIAALLAACPELNRVVLWGLCDGASAALLHLHATADPRVAGLCLVNPWVRSDASLARTHVRHYYRQRLMQAEFWSKLLGGRVALGAFKAALASMRLARGGAAAHVVGPTSYQDRMAAAWHAFDGALLLVLSGTDYTAREFSDHLDTDASWRGAWRHPRRQRIDIAGADHTFSQAPQRRAVEDATLHWLAHAGF